MVGRSKSQQKKKWYYTLFHPSTTGKSLFLERSQFRSILQKAFSINSQPNSITFPELPKVIIWMRCIIAIVYGTVLGIRNVRGSIMILNAINLITFIPYMYCRFYLNVAMDTYYITTSTTTTTENNDKNPPPNMSLLLVGVLPAIALTLLIWIYYFTLFHEAEIELFMSSTVGLLLRNDDTTTTTTLITKHTSSSNDERMMEVNMVPPLEDTEF